MGSWVIYLKTPDVMRQCVAVVDMTESRVPGYYANSNSTHAQKKNDPRGLTRAEKLKM